ncbi:tetratricopeptide repeat protein [Candidatus Poribacteria bacterium]|nr:tetratricopeptide repeat protein [Candidatus Poribacteria bacterium]
MKCFRFGSLILVTLMIVAQYGCVSGGVSGKADKLVEERDYQGAIEIYQVAIDAKPGTAEARKAQLAMGKLYTEKMNQPEQGVKVYKEITDSAPESEDAAEAYYRLGMYYFRSKDYESAQKNFDAVVNKFPELELSHNAQLMLAKSYEEAQNFEQAAEIYNNAANRNPRSKRAALALVNKARIEIEHLNQEDQARQTYQRLVKKYGKLSDSQEQIDEAKRELKAMGASIPEPEDPLATQQGRALARQLERRERDRPRGTVERSRAMGSPAAEVNSGFGVSASSVMRQFGGVSGGAIQGDEQGTYYDAMLMIANFQFGDENYPSAGALYHRAIELAKSDNAKIDPYSYLRLSVCYRKVGMHQRAAEVLKEAVKRDREVLDAVINTGRNHYTDENYERAIETYQSVLGLNRTKDPEIYWLTSLAYKKMNQPQDELNALEHAVAAKVDYTDALQSLAEVLHYRLKERKRAGIFQDLVDGKGSSYDGEKELGDVCYKYGNYTWAKSKYKAAARIAKRLRKKSENKAEQRKLDDQVVYANIRAAMAAYKLNREDEMQEIVDTLTAEYPEHSLMPYGRGELALLKGDTETAIAAFKESIEKAPHSDIAPIALGEYYLSQGFLDDAAAVWEAFLENNRYNQNVLRRLNKLKGNSEGQTDSDEESK